MVDEQRIRIPGQALQFRLLPCLEDLDRVRTMVETTRFFSAAEVEIAVELVDERLKKGPASGYEFIFAEHKGSVVGYTCFGEIPCTVGSYDLYWIVVDPRAQGVGVGRQLFERTVSAVKGRGGRRVFADTSGREQYLPTRRFYERLGFTEEARFRDFYAPGDDKVVFGISP